MGDNPLTIALRQFEAAEANLVKLEKLPMKLFPLFRRRWRVVAAGMPEIVKVESSNTRQFLLAASPWRGEGNSADAAE